MAVSSIVIIVCAVAGGAIVLAVAFKLILAAHRRRTNPPAPLPPARPLTMLQETPWAPSRQHHPNSSTHSLHANSPRTGPSMSQRSDSRFMYSQYRESGTQEALLRQPPSPMSSPSVSGYHTEQLIPPQPMFLQNDGSSGSGDRSSAHLSWNSATDESEMGGYPPQRQQSSPSFPPSVFTDPLVLDESSSANGSNPPSPMLPGTAGPRAKRLSMQTTGSSIRTNNNNTPSGSRSNGVPSVRSTRSLAAVRGAPHRPHSRVDIVLPAPLAPQVPDSRPQSQYNEGGLSGTSSRMSVCDPWLNVGRAGIAPSQPSGGAKADSQRPRRPSDASRPKARHSSSSRTASTDATLSSFSSSSRSSSYTASSIQAPPQLQQASPSTRSRKTSVDTSQLPPVPRVPSMYSNSNPASRSGSAAPSPVGLSAPKLLPSVANDVVNEKMMFPVREDSVAIAV